MTDDLRDRFAEALTREHYRRARDRVAASPEEHCAAFADVAMAVVQTEIDRLAGQFEDERERARLAEQDEFNFEGRAKRAEAAIDRVRTLLDMAIASSWEDTPGGDAVREARAALDQPKEQT